MQQTGGAEAKVHPSRKRSAGDCTDPTEGAAADAANKPVCTKFPRRATGSAAAAAGSAKEQPTGRQLWTATTRLTKL